MLVKIDDLPKKIVSANNSAKSFRTPKFWEMINCNLAVRVFKNLEAINTLWDVTLRSQEAQRAFRKLSQIVNWQIESELKTKTPLALNTFPYIKYGGGN